MEVFGCLADADVFKYFCSEKIFLFLIIIFFVTYTEIIMIMVRLRRRHPATAGAQEGQEVGQGTTHVLGSSALHCDLTRNVSQLLTYLRLLFSLPRSHPSATKDLNI